MVQKINNIKKIFSKEKNQKKINPFGNDTKVITIASGKGGVGKSSFTVNLGLALKEAGCRVIIIDADLSFPNIETLLGVVPKFTMEDIILNEVNISEALEGEDNEIKFISGGSGIESLINIDENKLDKFIKNISLLERLADYILIDTTTGLNGTMKKLVEKSDEVIVITTSEPTSIMKTYSFLKLFSLSGMKKKISIVVNKSFNIEEANTVVKSLNNICEKFFNITVKNMGSVRYDHNYRNAAIVQIPFLIKYSRSRSANSVRTIAKNLIGQE